jgi:hypothetical protein
LSRATVAFFAGAASSAQIEAWLARATASAEGPRLQRAPRDES